MKCKNMLKLLDKEFPCTNEADHDDVCGRCWFYIMNGVWPDRRQTKIGEM